MTRHFILLSLLITPQNMTAAASTSSAPTTTQDNLVSSGDPGRIEDHWALADKLTQRRAYCRAVEHLTEIESLQGSAIRENRAAAAQAFFQCSKTQWGKQNAHEAARLLAKSKQIVGQRPEFRDLEFKLAIYHVRQGVQNEDLESIRQHLEAAHNLGRDTGPGRENRLAADAIPLIHNVIAELSAWALALLDADDIDLADQASAVALEYNPRDRVALSVRKSIVFSQTVLPASILVLLAMAVLAILWRLWRSHTIKRSAAAFDDEP